jgi:hypothetical protein
MGGQHATRGILLQAFACLLDSFEEGWTSVGIESKDEADAADLVWQRDAFKKAVQVKSSQNQIGQREVALWCAELRMSVRADEYELRLFGPCTQSVINNPKVGGVSVPTPEALKPEVLIETCAQRLDKLLCRSGLPSPPPEQRERIVKSLICDIFVGATHGSTWTKEDFLTLIRAEAADFAYRWDSPNSASLVIGAPRGLYSPYLIATLRTESGTTSIQATARANRFGTGPSDKDYSITFDLTNRSTVPARVVDLVVGVLAWREASDVVHVQCQAATGKLQKFRCVANRDLKKYSATFAHSNFGYPKILPGEMECLRLSVNVLTPGWYTFEIYVIASLNGEEHRLPVGEFKDILFL